MPTRKGALSWALYDWANSAFATTVMAGFFPIFFKDFWSQGTPATVSTFWLGVSVATASLLTSVMAPVLGAFADRGAARKRFLLAFVVFGVLMTTGLYAVEAGRWPLAAGLYTLASVGFYGANVFYDSLIVSVSDEASVHIVSGRGYALGYLGGGLLFLLNVIMVQHPRAFGLSSPAGAVQFSFLTVAIWWTVFSIPIFLRVDEPAGGERMSLLRAVREGFRQIISTFHEIRRLKSLLMFLLAYWLYIDGVDTIIAMAVDFGKAIGISTNELVTALLMVQFVAFPFAYLLGHVGQKLGPKRVILACIGVYVGVTVLGAQMNLRPFNLLGFHVSKFYTLAFLVGTVQGGIQALSRSFYSQLIPPDRAAEFYGFYNMLGKFAAIIGPILMGTVGRITGEPRAGIQSIALLFIVGGLLLWRCTEKPGLRRV